MPDGSLVQNLDLENVVSRRRNPVIADMFGRLDFMERRGSGFKKILEDYRFEEKFSENKTPVFRSDPYSFSVTLYNLNYEEGVGNDGGETSEEHRKNIGRTSGEHRENSSIEMNATQKKILERLAFKPDSTAVELSIQIGIARRNIEANIKVLKEMGLLVRHGSTKSGYWEVISNSNQK